MAMPSSGEIKFSQLQTEFGGSNPIQLSEYYSKGNAPASGEIQLGADFHGTSNIIYGARSISGFTNNSHSLDTGTKKFGAASLNDNTGGQSISGPNDTLSQLNGETYWTIQFWVYRTGSSTWQDVMGNNTSGYTNAVSIRIGSSDQNKVTLADWGNGQFALVKSSTATPANTWQHVAIVKNGNNVKIFQDGTQTASRDNTNNSFQGGLGFRIGNRTNGDMPLRSNIDDLVIWKGVAKYSSNFTAPTTQFHPENDAHGDKVVLWMPFNSSVTEAYEGYLL